MDLSSQEELKKDCPLGQICDWKFLYNSKFQNYNLPIYLCGNCGLQRLHPKPNNLHELYGEDYYSGKAEFAYLDERKNEKYQSFVWDARLKNIQKFKKSGKFLDIGSSFGGFLLRAQRMGFQPYGVEISPYSSEIAKSRGLEIFTGKFLDSQFPKESFSVITLIEVIEHLEEPNLVFQELYRILEPGGLLILQTANFDGWQAKKEKENYHYYLPGHLFYYSADNLKISLRKQGFDAIRVYYGVDFPLWAKLLKSRGSFQKFRDYLKWFRISWYHFKSKFSHLGYPLTSSMVLYAWKPK